MTLLNGQEFQVERSKGSGLDSFDAAIFAASCDDVETNKKYAQALKLDYPILSDPGCKAAQVLGVAAEGRGMAQRWTYYIDKDGKVLHIDKEVKAATHGEAIAKTLEELGIARK